MHPIGLQTMSLISELGLRAAVRCQEVLFPLDFESEESVSRHRDGRSTSSPKRASVVIATEAHLDRKTAEDAMGLLAVMIGELMEDHVDMAISAPLAADAAARLRRAGEDITCLAAAMQVIARRAEEAPAQD
jgi:hypothetical protein